MRKNLEELVLIGRVTAGRRSMTQLANDLLKQISLVYMDILKLKQDGHICLIVSSLSWGLVLS